MLRINIKKTKLAITIMMLVLFSFTTFAATAITPIEQNAINILNGNYAPYYFSKEHQIYLKANAIKNLNKSIHTVIIGSSHLQSLTKDDVGTECINLSIGGGTFQDKLNMLGLLDYYKVQYSRVIMDFTLVELCGFVLEDATKNPLNSFGNYFVKAIRKKKKGTPITDYNKYYKNDENFDLTKTYNKLELNKDEFYYRSDFSTLYSDLVYKNRDGHMKMLDDIIKSEANIQYFKVSNEARAIVIDMVKYLNNKNVKINLMMAPKPPAIFDSLEMYKFDVVREMTALFISLVVDYGCRVEGAYDPHFIGATMDDFYDAYHMYPESFRKFYKFD